MKIFKLGLLLFLITGLSYAQDDLPAPEDIFIDGVQWSIFEEDPIEQRIVKLDYQRQVIQFYDKSNDRWREYPYPEGKNIDSASLESDRLIHIFIEYPFLDNSFDGDLRASNILLLDPQTGLYEEPKTVCEGRIAQSLPHEGRWTVAYDDDAYQEAYLCHSETGEEINILPEGNFEWKVFTSPNEKKLIFIAQGWDATEGSIIYFYNLETKQLVQQTLKDTHTDEYVTLCDWVSDTKGLICASDRYRSWPGVGYYAFDITANTIEPAFGAWSENTFHIEDPKRYVAMSSERYTSSYTGSAGNGDPCSLTVYDAENLQRQDLGYECNLIFLDSATIASYYRNGDIIYFLTVASEDSTISELHAYDVRTQSNPDFPIFSGEIESILSVSPDGQYVALLIDDNGELDFSPSQFGCCQKDDDGLQVLIIRVNRIDGYYDFEMVYRTEPIGVYMSSQAIWTDSSTLILSTLRTMEQFPMTEKGESINYFRPPSLYRISLGDTVDMMMTTRYGYDTDYDYEGLAISPDHRFLVRDTSIINLDNLETIPIIRDNLPQDYSIYSSWLDNGDLKVRLSLKSDYKISAEYRVMLPKK